MPIRPSDALRRFFCPNNPSPKGFYLVRNRVFPVGEGVIIGRSRGYILLVEGFYPVRDVVFPVVKGVIMGQSRGYIRLVKGFYLVRDVVYLLVGGVLARPEGTIIAVDKNTESEDKKPHWGAPKKPPNGVVSR